ncbi:MAG: tetrahydromethanopterin S-methyltransferase subunit H [Candidatus Bathyarchaeia archaeon]
MFKFDNEQKIFEIGGVKVGGQPGQLPTVMIGSIFYHGDTVIIDEEEGTFDKEKAEEVLRVEAEVSEKTGNPRIVDVCGAWPKAIVRFIDFVSEKIDGPFLVDGTTSTVRAAAARHVAEIGLSERAVFNSISPEAKPEELEALKDSKIKAAILLTYNSRNMTVAGKLSTLRDSPERKGLISVASEAGIEKMLVDTTVLDIPDPGPVAKACHIVKKEFGLPSGAGVHNAVDRWVSRKKQDHLTYRINNAVAHVTPIVMGANFLLYGPVRRAPEIYPACALADAYVSYSMRQEYGIRPISNSHPVFKIFL